MDLFTHGALGVPLSGTYRGCVDLASVENMATVPSANSNSPLLALSICIRSERAVFLSVSPENVELQQLCCRTYCTVTLLMVACQPGRPRVDRSPPRCEYRFVFSTESADVAKILIALVCSIHKIPRTRTGHAGFSRQEEMMRGKKSPYSAWKAWYAPHPPHLRLRLMLVNTTAVLRNLRVPQCPHARPVMPGEEYVSPLRYTTERETFSNIPREQGRPQLRACTKERGLPPRSISLSYRRRCAKQGRGATG